jgi:hypothetical protein
MEFVFTGDIPTMGRIAGLKATNRVTGKQFGGETNFDGGDAGLQYRFWNQAENGYKGSSISNSELDSADDEISAEEAAFLGLENLFACRRQCKGDLGGASSLRQCIRNCKGKGLKNSALKTKDLEIQQQMAEALKTAAAPAPEPETKKTNTVLWVVLSVVVLVIIILLIYFLTRKKVESTEV